jgi:hypothetical protein
MRFERSDLCLSALVACASWARHPWLISAGFAGSRILRR